MRRPRVIPVLLLGKAGLVKTVRFRQQTYIGDPVNAVRIFNEKEVDEIVVLDIEAARTRQKPRFKLIEEIASECFMPLAYGGGVTSVEDVKTLVGLGVEKVIINSGALENPALIRQSADQIGSQSIVASVDIGKNFWGKYRIFTHGGSRQVKQDPLVVARSMVENGAGELLLQCIHRDGTMAGYDLDLIRMFADAVPVPLIACGGAGGLKDFALALRDGRASAIAAGSYFVYQGKYKAVLISYPRIEDVRKVIEDLGNA